MAALGHKLEILTVPALTDNYCYLIVDRASKKAVVIDPSESEPVLAALAELRLNLTLILNTHHHHDHVGGNKELAEDFGCPIWCSNTDLTRVPGATRGLREGDTFEIFGEECRVLEIPGHTLGQLAFYLPDEKAVFVGDTLFAMGCGRLFEGSAELMWSSLQKIMRLPKDTRIYFGHEYAARNSQFAKKFEPSNAQIDSRIAQAELQVEKHGYSEAPTLENEEQINPFLRPHSPEIRAHLGMIQSSDVEVFAKLRELRNSF